MFDAIKTQLENHRTAVERCLSGQQATTQTLEKSALPILREMEEAGRNHGAAAAIAVYSRAEHMPPRLLPACNSNTPRPARRTRRRAK